MYSGADWYITYGFVPFIIELDDEDKLPRIHMFSLEYITTSSAIIHAQTVLGWVWESVDKTATEAALAANIALQKNPVTATGTPWGQA